jgi:hypothetical protein
MLLSLGLNEPLRSDRDVDSLFRRCVWASPLSLIAGTRAMQDVAAHKACHLGFKCCAEIVLFTFNNVPVVVSQITSR